jgi:hypothetical protein
MSLYLIANRSGSRVGASFPAAWNSLMTWRRAAV